MFRNYLASPKDLEAIEETLRYVWHPKMRFVFSDKSKIANTIVISYDSKFIYLWTKKQLRGLETLTSRPRGYFAYKLPHTLKLKEEWQFAWCSGLWDKNIEKALPVSIKKANHFEIPRISGGLFTPFVEFQSTFKKQGSNTNWPYTTYESYLATIIHEFGHVYWNQHKLWWSSDKKRNLAYLTLAKNLYQNKINKKRISLNFSTPHYLGEVFAFCTEYFASGLFWPPHKRALDSSNESRLQRLIKEERGKDLEKKDSVLEPTKNPHNYAWTVGKILITQSPTNWVDILTKPPNL